MRKQLNAHNATSRRATVERKFVGFASTTPPTQSTRHQYSAIAGKPLVQHKSLLAELETIHQLLESEARAQSKRCKWEELVAVLQQFIVESTHRAI